MAIFLSRRACLLRSMIKLLSSSSSSLDVFAPRRLLPQQKTILRFVTFGHTTRHPKPVFQHSQFEYTVYSHQRKHAKARASRAASHDPLRLWPAVRPRGHLRSGESYIVRASWLCARRDEPRVLVRLLLLLRLGPTVTPVCGPREHGFGALGWWWSGPATGPATRRPVVQALPLAWQPD